MTGDFTLHFDIPNVGERPDLNQAEMERAFAREQIRILLDFVTLYQDGKPLNPDAFSIVSQPTEQYELTDAQTVQHE